MLGPLLTPNLLDIKELRAPKDREHRKVSDAGAVEQYLAALPGVLAVHDLLI